MKRVLCIIIILTFLLSGCNLNGRPANLSPECFQIGMNVLKAVDDYLDEDVTAIIAVGQIQNQCRLLGGIRDEENTQNQAVKNYCEILSYTLMLVADGDHINAGEIITSRNNLAALLGEDRRED